MTKSPEELLGVMKMFRIPVRVYILVKTQKNLHLKWVHFIVCKLYLNNINQKEKQSKTGYIYAYVKIILSLDMRKGRQMVTSRDPLRHC